MEERRRGVVGAGMVKFVFALLLLTTLCGRVAVALDDDGELLMLFKRAVTADPLGALDGWSVSDATACAWNGVICNGFPAPQRQQQAGATANVTSTTDGISISNTTTLATVPVRANGTTTSRGLDASAVTVSRVIGLVLPNAQLSATLPPDLARLQHLRHLDLSGNNVTGALPPALLLNATELRVLALAGNDITGALPDGAPSHGLQELNLSDNALAGWLPGALLTAPGLTVLGLANNYLAGELPAGGLGAQLEVVDLSSNYFRGPLPPDFSGEKLRLLNVSSNRLTGALPAELSDVVPANTTVDLSNNNFTGAVPTAGPFAVQPAAAYEGNPELCGPPLKHACSIPSSLSNPPNATDSPPAFAAIPKSAARAPPGSPEAQAPRGGQGKLRPLTILAIVAGDLAGVGLLFALFLYVYHVRKKRRQGREENPTAPLQQQQKKTAAIAVSGAKEDKPSASVGCCIGGGRSDGSEDSSDCSASCSDAASDDGGEEVKKRAGSFIGWSTPQHHSKKHEPQQQTPAPATLVTVDGGDGELEMETLLKASAYILGATGSSIVYKAVLADGTALAVRRIGESGGADKLKDFEAQVRAVARFRHPNVLRLRGFYWGADEKLLIHDYAINGSLANISFTRRMGTLSSPMHLNLEARLRIARGVARGLAFIHEKKGVHGNVKPSNILLGADMEALVGDLGLDRLLSGAALHRNTGASARLFGSKRSMHSTSSLPDLSQMPGGASPSCASTSSAAPLQPYQAPECLKSLRPNAKWDVYSFGMVLLELLSGRVYSEVELCQWHAGAATTELDQRCRVLRMADPTLRGEAGDNEDALLGCFRLAFACCAMAPGKRPAMRDAAAFLDRIPAAVPSASTALEIPY